MARMCKSSCAASRVYLHGKIMDSIKFEAGNLCMVTGGRNTGRVGTIMHRERHPGSFDIVHVKVILNSYFPCEKSTLDLT